MDVFYKPNAASQSTSEAFVGALQGVAMEWSGLRAVLPLDAVNHAAGLGVTISTGATPNTVQANELALAFFSAPGQTPSGVTGGYTTAVSFSGLLAAYKSISAIGSQSSTATITSDFWSGAIATFRT